MNNKILLNGTIGAFFFGLFTYFVEIFEKNPNYLKISSFLWTAPFFFFFMVYVTMSKSDTALISFTKHALFGTIISILVFSVTLLISNLPMYIIISINLFITIFALFIYINYKIYNY
tara:strand:- start:953 stop:1303 length:351 start_codon:yes stop_codon:yes gene_type:complete